MLNRRRFLWSRRFALKTINIGFIIFNSGQGVSAERAANQNITYPAGRVFKTLTRSWVLDVDASLVSPVRGVQGSPGKLGFGASRRDKPPGRKNTFVNWLWRCARLTGKGSYWTKRPHRRPQSIRKASIDGGLRSLIGG
jgi:hypothetical protein